MSRQAYSDSHLVDTKESVRYKLSEPESNAGILPQLATISKPFNYQKSEGFGFELVRCSGAIVISGEFES